MGKLLLLVFVLRVSCCCRSCPQYIHYKLQLGLPLSPSQPPSRSASTRFQCRQCRELLAAGEHEIPHLPGRWPDWWAGAGAGRCTSGVLIMPPDWLPHPVDWSFSSRLLCPRCKSKLGSFGLVRCSCANMGGKGVILNLARVDRMVSTQSIYTAS